MALQDAQPALHNVDMKGFKDVEFQYDKFHTMGGHLRSPMPMTTRRGFNKAMYLKMAKTEPWLMLGTSGMKKPPPMTFGSNCLL